MYSVELDLYEFRQFGTQYNIPKEAGSNAEYVLATADITSLLVEFIGVVT